MHHLAAAFSAALALTVAPVASAQMGGHDHSSHGAAKPAASSTKSTFAEGDVRKVDRSKGTITLRHGPLEALGMGPMTMVFVAADPKQLANVKEGDKVRFVPTQGKDGTLMVSKLEVVR